MNTPWSDRRSALLLVAVAAAVALVVAVTTVLVLRQDPSASAPGPGSSPSAATTPTARPTVVPTPTVVTPEPSPSPSTQKPSAVVALQPFLSRAATLDRQLKAAAVAINSAGPPWVSVSSDVARTVKAADLDPVAGAVPAGLPPALLRSVTLVFSDLTSRRAALSSFAYAGPTDPSANLLRELRNGHATAARFDNDLAAARALAAATPPIKAVPRQSRSTAEALLLVRYVRLANQGCAGRGGVVVTQLPVIAWGSVAGAPDAEGTIGGIAFDAELTGNGSWQLNLYAC